ncbi:DUF805 domain-containing protein [Brucella intermedia]|uniref:DUF805 domain-containing protein n=1 Tax=Brucella intermedia TaxID=94625 RepID=A0A7V6PA06_9HYPH|nr:DUF805 domain-containing protein [Brucella intermedia]WGG61276.1 DUF805 domain-containing protein [Brucella intermedia]HHV67159.1 DUF805 domain-containing protein [Brucella intermedia]
MKFSESIKNVVLRNFATFAGRASRSEYWWFQLTYYSLVLLYALVFTPFSVFIESAQWGALHGLILSLIAFCTLAMMATIIPLVALQVRRFHDCNLSGWWLVALFMAGNIPYVGYLCLGAVLVISCLKGTDGLNKFGTEPA